LADYDSFVENGKVSIGMLRNTFNIGKDKAYDVRDMVERQRKKI